MLHDSDPFVEHYEWRARKGLVDPDIAAVLIADYRERTSAVSGLRRLSDIPRPKPLKLNGPRRVARAARTA
ncbi:MAG: hypothetical protein OXH75_02575 [Acidobacteria bacterium]|nr:hypothetical protein [Acidobacteriota bacterium]